MFAYFACQDWSYSSFIVDHNQALFKLRKKKLFLVLFLTHWWNCKSYLHNLYSFFSLIFFLNSRLHMKHFMSLMKELILLQLKLSTLGTSSKVLILPEPVQLKLKSLWITLLNSWVQNLKWMEFWMIQIRWHIC